MGIVRESIVGVFHMKFEIFFILSILSLLFFWLSSSSNVTPSESSAYTHPRRHPFWYLIAMLIRSEICCCSAAFKLVSRWLAPTWLSTSNSYFRLTLLPRIQITMPTMQMSSAQMAIAPPAIPASSIIIMRDGVAVNSGRLGIFEIMNFALF